MTDAFEVNFDGLVGPTHNYSGLSFGNLASTQNKASVSNPKEAALQGLKKMRFLTSLGIKQGVLPPQDRPDIQTLRKLGFSGSDEKVLYQAKKEAPEILSAVWSGSSMWTANAATVTPSSDSADQKVHFTVANLMSKFHRSLEHQTTFRILKTIFADENYFTHHGALPSCETFGDEGAANHTRFCNQYGDPGIHLFVYGRRAFSYAMETTTHPIVFPARQTLEASTAIARLHLIPKERIVFAQQNPAVIDAGAFHNDVVAVGNRDTLFYHEAAYVNSEQVFEKLQYQFQQINSKDLKIIKVGLKDISLSQAVKSYIFNSQLISLQNPKDAMALIAPLECKDNSNVHRFLENLKANTEQPIREIYYLNLRESMKNGGGPACLRFRVILTEEEIKKSNPGVYFTEYLYQRLYEWINKHYRDRLTIDDLVDPALIQESQTALDRLCQILNLASIYPFQQITLT